MEALLRPRGSAGLSPLAGSLRRCAEVCEEAVAAYLEPAEASTNEFGQSLLAAVAAMEAAAVHDDALDEQREAALAITATVSRSAADACRRYGLDQLLLRAAATCDHAAALCEQTRARAPAPLRTDAAETKSRAGRGASARAALPDTEAVAGGVAEGGHP